MSLPHGIRVRRTAAATIVALVVLAVAAVRLSTAGATSIDQLSSQLSQQQAHQQSLSSRIAGLSQLISSLDGQISLVQSREEAVRAELDRDRAALAAARVSLARERALLVVLRARLTRARMLLSRQLVSGYESDRPDVVSVVLNAHGFSDLLEKLDFLHRAQQQQQTIISQTRTAKARADRAARRLAAIEATDRRITQGTALHVGALAGMNALLQSKQSALGQARAAQ